MCGAIPFILRSKRSLKSLFGRCELYKHFTPDGVNGRPRRSNYLVRPTSGRLFD
jgi:hypothetical protein